MPEAKRDNALLVVSLIVGLCSGATFADWPNFRGARHDGISLEKNLKTAWTAAPSAVWDKSVGSAFSSFACVGDRVFTCGTAKGRQVALCLNADTGETIWQVPIEEAYSEDAGGDGPRATPTIDQDRVYVLGALGTLLCLGSDTGEQVWKSRLTNPPQWGYSGSVLIEGDLAIATGGRGDGALVAFDKMTGKVAWRCGDDIAGYATPYPFVFGGQKYIVGFTGTSALIAEAKSGREVWRMPWKTDWDVNAAAPIFNDGHLFLSSGYDTGCALFKLSENGKRITAEEVWRSKVLMSKFQSCILHDGRLYASDQKALVCVDFMTGKENWRIRRIKHGTVVLADGHLFVLTEKGRLQIAKVDPAGFQPTADVPILDGRCWTVPVLHRGKLYARNLERVVCLDLSR